eukprot:m.119602 g.119602  ORF g.119602 m.119602 type:complete len:147 (+) comp14324_c0_seq1:211-651(+)
MKCSFSSFVSTVVYRYKLLLKDLVQCGSFTKDPVGVTTQAEKTARMFREAGLGAQATFVPSKDSNHGPHLVLSNTVKKSATKPTSRIALISHLDTVYSNIELEQENFQWKDDVIQTDRVIGPGTMDIKGGTMVALMVYDRTSFLCS